VQPQPKFTNMVELLLPVWQRVLQRSSIKVDDRFFDLGGNPALARQLLSEVSKVTGREFPAVSIFHMDNLAAMASVLDGSTVPRFPPPILLKRGVENPPVFLAHGIGASILDFHPLIEEIKTKRSIYGIQSPGIYGTQEPQQYVEEMAEFHLEAIKKTQVSGPYTLIGYSLGGLVMLEVARRLHKDGESVALLVLIDSYPYRTYLDEWQKIRLYSRLAGRRLKGLLGFKTQDSASRLARKARAISQLQQAQAGETKEKLAERYERERECAYEALKSYQPHFLDQRIKFIRASVLTDFPADAQAVWGPLVRQLEVKTIPGDHLGILNSNFKLLATTLSEYLDETETRS
jgi:thioesterase domain-containing protein